MPALTQLTDQLSTCISSSAQLGPTDGEYQRKCLHHWATFDPGLRNSTYPIVNIGKFGTWDQILPRDNEKLDISDENLYR